MKNICLAAIAAACSTGSAAPTITSTFDSDDQGWSTNKDARDFE